MSETNGTTPEQPTTPPPIGVNIQLTPQGVLLQFPVNLGLDNDMMKQLVKLYLQEHPELVQEIVQEAIKQQQQEIKIIQAVKRSRND